MKRKTGIISVGIDEKTEAYVWQNLHTNLPDDGMIEMNVEKLKARYPGGEYSDVCSSENRADWETCELL